MSVVIKSAEMSYKDPDSGEYIGINVVADKKTSEQIAAVVSEGTTQVNAVTAAGTAAIALFPETYDPCDSLARDFALPYDNSTVTGRAYSIGDYCVYQYILYRCIADIALGADNSFVSAHWVQVNTGFEIVGIKNNLISKDNLKYIDVLNSSGLESRNLFDINADNSLNGYYDKTNTFVSSTIVGMTDYIPIVASCRYYCNNSGSGYVLWFDSNKKYVGYSDYSATHEVLIKAPDYAAYAKFLFLIEKVASFYVGCIDTLYLNMDGVKDTAQRIKAAIIFSPNLLNKYDPDFVTDGYYNLSSQGIYTFISQQNYVQSGFIKVTSGLKYTSNFKSANVLWYNNLKAPISQTSWASFTSDGYVTAPSNAYYARFICVTTNSAYDTWQVVQGEVLPPYQSYESIRFVDVILDSEYFGLSGVAFGTSLTYRSQSTGGYLNYLPELSGIDFDNQGIGNATILVTSDFPTLDILQQVKNYSSYASKDIVILEGFVNDWNRNHDKLGLYTDTTETTVCGCVRSALNYIQTQNEDITIFLVLDHYGQGVSASTALNGSNITMYAYYEEIKKVAESMGIIVIPLYTISEMNEHTPQYFIDNIHPTSLGAQQTARVIWSAMKMYLPKIVSD